MCENLSFNSRPTFIFTSLDRSSAFIARVQILYYIDVEPCEICYKTSHDVLDCEHMEMVWKSKYFYKKMKLMVGGLLDLKMSIARKMYLFMALESRRLRKFRWFFKFLEGHSVEFF